MRSKPPRSARVAWAWLQGTPLRRRRLRQILRMLDGCAPRGATLLDVGGGSGVGSEEAVRVAPSGTYARVIVIDPQRGMLERGQRRPRGTLRRDWLRGTGALLPLADRSADVLVSFGVLCCMEDSAVARAVTEFWRVLRPGGYWLLGVPRGWAPTSDVEFRTAGFVVVRQQRPGRVLYRRPAAPPGELTPRA
ncbi:MAG: class I SAM-dependent methyltransferase [Thermoplasmata archaeon]